MTRRAFTLVEVTVAIVVTGLVAAMVYAAMQAGFSTADRLAQTREGAERQVVARSILANALRHALSGTLGGEPVILLRDGGQGARNDEIRFRTRGVLEPLGASGIWEISLAPTTDGVRLEGRPVDGPGAAFAALLPHVRSVDVRVRGRDSRDGWLETWIAVDRSPVAVSITFIGIDGQPVGAPLIARVGLEGNP